MFADIVFPKGNEREYIKVAEKLGIRAVVFAYMYDQDFNTKSIQVKPTKSVSVFFAGLIRSAVAAKGIKACKGRKPDLSLVRSSKFNREIIDRGQVDLIYDYAVHPGNDSLMQKKSNLNHIMAKKCYDNGIILGVNANSLILAPKKDRIKYFGRIQQNLMLAQKYDVQVTVFSGAKRPMLMRSFTDMFSLLQAISRKDLSKSQIRKVLYNRIK